jgi:hypothetical protein
MPLTVLRVRVLARSVEDGSPSFGEVLVSNGQTYDFERHHSGTGWVFSVRARWVRDAVPLPAKFVPKHLNSLLTNALMALAEQALAA